MPIGVIDQVESISFLIIEIGMGFDTLMGVFILEHVRVPPRKLGVYRKHDLSEAMIGSNGRRQLSEVVIAGRRG